MKIALRANLDSKHTNYRGVNRKDKAYVFSDKTNREKINSLWDWYLDEEVKGSIEYTKENKDRLLELYALSKSSGYQGELIIYGSVNETVRNAHFLGFDVCSVSEGYYSILGDGLACDKPYNKLVTTKIIWSYFYPKLNGNGLFDTINDANEFIQLVDEFYTNWKYYFVEAGKLYPTRVYSLTN